MEPPLAAGSAPFPPRATAVLGSSGTVDLRQSFAQPFLGAYDVLGPNDTPLAFVRRGGPSAGIPLMNWTIQATDGTPLLFIRPRRPPGAGLFTPPITELLTADLNVIGSIRTKFREGVSLERSGSVSLRAPSLGLRRDNFQIVYGSTPVATVADAGPVWVSPWSPGRMRITFLPTSADPEMRAAAVVLVTYVATTRPPRRQFPA